MQEVDALIVKLREALGVVFNSIERYALASVEARPSTSPPAVVQVEQLDPLDPPVQVWKALMQALNSDNPDNIEPVMQRLSRLAPADGD